MLLLCIDCVANDCGLIKPTISHLSYKVYDIGIALKKSVDLIVIVVQFPLSDPHPHTFISHLQIVEYNHLEK